MKKGKYFSYNDETVGEILFNNLYTDIPLDKETYDKRILCCVNAVRKTRVLLYGKSKIQFNKEKNKGNIKLDTNNNILITDLKAEIAKLKFIVENHDNEIKRLSNMYSIIQNKFNNRVNQVNKRLRYLSKVADALKSREWFAEALANVKPYIPDYLKSNGKDHDEHVDF
jgi:hypothetical protein